MRRLLLTPLCLLLLTVAGCGGGEDEEPAATPEEFAERFEPITGLRLKLVPGDTFGTRLDRPEQPYRFPRFGTFSLVWSGDDRLRETLLGRGVEPDSEGIYWERVGDGWSAGKAFGPRLVMRWTGEETKRTTPKWDRLERAVRAAYLGQTDVLPPAEQPCEERGLDPLRGELGECSVEGMPVTFAEAVEPLRTPALEARVLGVETSDAISEETGVPERAEGRFVEVAYRVRNTGNRPIGFLRLALRLGGRSYEPAVGAGVFVPRSREFPIPPGESFETSVAFDVDPDLAERARENGALVVPAAIELGEPSPDLAQGWIRLAGAPARLPEPPEPEPIPGAPLPAPEPEGPPDIETDTGSGAPTGGSARRLFTFRSAV